MNKSGVNCKKSVKPLFCCYTLTVPQSPNLKTVYRYFVVIMSPYHQSPNLKTGYLYENQFWNPGFYKWGWAVLWISIFLVWNIILFYFFIFPIFSNLLNQNLHKCYEPKRKLVSFVQWYSFKFRALVVN